MSWAELRAFDVGAGDCLFLRLNNGNNVFSIMVDCGKFTQEVNNYVINVLQKRIDVLIVTHIDDDHISGLKTMVQSVDGLIIDSIFFNCAQKCSPADCKLLDKNIFDNILTPDVSLSPSDYIRNNIAATNALSLAELLMSNERFKNAWEKQRNYVTDEYPVVHLPEGFGSISFLSPQRRAISNLDKVFRKAFAEKGFARYEGPYNNEATIYELLLKNSDRPNDLSVEINTLKATPKKLSDLGAAIYPENITPTNEASIAFIWQGGDKQVLFCGDASSEVITCNLLKRSDTNRISYFEAIKVSHHGSKHNIGRMFWSTFDSSRIFVCGGSKRDNTPSKECVSTILSRECESPRNLYFTRQSDISDWIDDTALKQGCKFEVHHECIHGFEY